MNRMLSAALVAATLASTSCASAMSYSYRFVGDDTVIIDAKGEIAFDEAKIFSTWLSTSPAGVSHRPDFTVVLDSPGGNPYGAFDLGEIIRKAGGDTGTVENGVCASACVIAWAAGVKKSASATSHIGVHGARIVDDNANAAADKTAPVYEASTTLHIAQQLKLYGAPDNVVVKTMMTPSTDIYWLTREDVDAWSVKLIPAGATVVAQASTPPAPPTVRPKARPTQVDPPGLY
jgi:hypothetical protein